MSQRVALFAFIVTTLAASLILSGCGGKDPVLKTEYPMGEKVVLGPLTYNVIETVWRSQLGSSSRFASRSSDFC